MWRDSPGLWGPLNVITGVPTWGRLETLQARQWHEDVSRQEWWSRSQGGSQHLECGETRSSVFLGASREEQPCPQLDSRRLFFRAVREQMCVVLNQEKRMATHSSTLAREIPWTEELVGYSPWGHKEWTWLSYWACTPRFWGLNFNIFVGRKDTTQLIA